MSEPASEEVDAGAADGGGAGPGSGAGADVPASETDCFSGASVVGAARAGASGTGGGVESGVFGRQTVFLPKIRNLRFCTN